MTDITTATGKKFRSDYFVEHKPSKCVYFTVVGVSEEEARKVFTDPEETSSLEYNGKIYEGFTDLKNITEEDKGVWKMRLVKCNQ